MRKQVQALDRAISFRALFRFSLPTIASMVFMSVYSSVDGVFVSRLIGTDALSAVNIVMPVILFSLAVGTMFGSGGIALVAKLVGEEKEEQARRIFSLLAAAAFVFSLVLSAIGLLLMEPLLKALGADETLYRLCAEYVLPTLLMLPFSIFGVIFQMAFITIGRASLGLLGAIAGGIANIVLDYVFIAVFGMGISGAAIATGIGYSLPAFIGLAYFTFDRSKILYLTKPVWDLSAIWKSCSNGASEMVTSLSAGVVIVLLNNVLIRLAGSDGVAAITVILYLRGLLTAVYTGYAMGISPLISYNYGKGDTDRLRKIYGISLRAILAVALVTFVASLLLAPALVSFFVHDSSAVYAMAVHGYRIFAASCLFMGFNGFSSAMFTALNNGRVSAILSFFRTLVFIIAAVLILPMLWGLTGVWASIPAAELLGMVMTVYYFRKMKPVYGYA